MTALPAHTAVERPYLAKLAILWLVACAFLILVSAGTIATGSFPDPDDIMRLLEVRDWLGGQSWFDVTQYRLNGDLGVPMHWSRLVDVPIAAVILAARPFVGPDRAETVAIVFVPLLTLGIAMLLVDRIALKLMTPRAALVAAAATPLSLGALKQMRPMRIDHHGWQIVMALVGLLACLDQRPRRSGIIAGAAMALWLNISLEGLPYAVVIGALFAFEWVRNGSAPKRLEAFLAALALASAFFFATTHLPSTWLSQQHDVVTIAYVAGFLVSWISVSLVARVNLGRWSTRTAALGLVGLLVLAAMFLVDRNWMSGPFSSLDPLVRQFWYERVDEGLPMWQIDWSEGAIGLAQPIVGMIGAIAALITSNRNRAPWTVYLVLLFATTLCSISLLRIATTASVLAMPGTAFLCQLAFRRARAQTLLVARAVSTSAALLLMTPAYAVPVSIATTDPRLEKAVAAGGQCEKSGEIAKLRTLPVGEIAAPLDVTPAILLNTRDHAIATGHHRNRTGMRDAIRLFVFDPSVGEAIVKTRKVDYVVLCPGGPEAIRYAHRGPGGLAALLRAGRPPRWLEPLPVPGLRSLKVWRVRKELLS